MKTASHETRRARPERGTILVTGATGNVGRHLVENLSKDGVAVRALVRDPSTARLASGVEIVRGDLLIPETLDPSLRGVESVFLLWPSLDAGTAPAVLDRIARHARRVVFLSAASVPDDLDVPPTTFHGDIERLVARSGMVWTFLRPTGFATNTLGWAQQIKDGVVRWPYGRAARSLIHEADIADVAARVLTGDGHDSARYVLTGPEAITQFEQVKIIGDTVGRTVRYEELSPADARQQLLAAWGNPSFVDGALAYWASLESQPEQVTRTVEEITGKPARSFRQWANDHAADFR